MGAVASSDLAQVPLFATLSEPELAEVAAWFEVKEVGPGVRLCGEGTTGRSFFVLAEGAASVAVRGEEVTALAPGDFFGELALLGEGRRTASVTTTSPARVFVLFADDFRRLATGYPEIAARIEATVRARLERV